LLGPGTQFQKKEKKEVTGTIFPKTAPWGEKTMGAQGEPKGKEIDALGGCLVIGVKHRKA